MTKNNKKAHKKTKRTGVLLPMINKHLADKEHNFSTRFLKKNPC